MPKQLVTAFLAVCFLHQSFTWVIFGLWDEARDEVVSLARSRMTATIAVSSRDGTSGDSSSSIPSDTTVDCSPSHINSTTDRTPTFVIGGAQKAGTTALFYLLRAHPHIESSRRPEPHFFDNTRFPTRDAFDASDATICEIRKAYRKEFSEVIAPDSLTFEKVCDARPCRSERKESHSTDVFGR